MDSAQLHQPVAFTLRAPAQPDTALLGGLLSGHLILLGAAGVVLPLYGLARRPAGAAQALPLAAVGVLLPTTLLLSPAFDQLYVTLAAVLLYAAVRGLSAKARVGGWGFLAGLLAAGTLVPWALLAVAGNMDVPGLLGYIGSTHLGGTMAVRPYQPWVVYNLVEFLQIAGLPLVLVTVLTLAWRSTRGSRPPRRPRPLLCPPLALSFAAAGCGPNSRRKALDSWAGIGYNREDAAFSPAGRPMGAQS